MIKFKSLTNKMVVSISIAIIAFAAIAIPTLVHNEKQDIINHTCDEIELMAKTEAIKITKYVDLMIDKSKNQDILMRIGVDSKKATREAGDRLMLKLIESDESSTSVWAVFFANVYDNKDNEYKNSKRYGKSGSYSVWYHKHSSPKAILDTLANFEQDKWFLACNNSRTLEILEPYTYKLDNGENFNIITIVHPILQNDTLIGYTGSDLDVNYINKKISDISFFGNDYACFISHKGNYVTNPVKELVGTHIATEVFDEKSLQAFQNGEAFHSSHHSAYLNTEVFDFYIPLKFRDYDKTWYVRLSAPQYIITEKVDAYRAKVFMLFAITSLFFIAVVFLINYFSIKPLTRISQNILNLASKGTAGAKTLNLKSNDEIGTLSKSYNNLIESLTEKEKLDIEVQQKEQNFRNLFDQSADAIFLLLPENGQIIDCNKNALEMLVVENKEELIGKTPLDFSPEKQANGESSAQLAMANMQKAYTEGYHRFEFIHTNSKGESFTALITLSKVNYNNEEIFLANLRDITEKKIQEQKIYKSEQNLAVTLNSIGDAIIATDQDRLITRMNPVAEKLTGWTFEEAKGKSIDDVFVIVHAETRKAQPNPVDHVLESGETQELANHTVLVAKNGNELHIADAAAPIRNSKNEIIGVILNFRDVTERYKARQALKKSQEEVQEVFDNAPIIMMLVDEQRRIRKINQTGAKITGIDENTVLGMTKGALFNCNNLHKEGKPCGATSFCSLCPIRKLVSETFKNKSGVFGREGSLDVQKNGQKETLHLLMFSSYLFADTNEPQVLLSLHDITLQKQQEQKIRQSEERYSFLLNNINDTVWGAEIHKSLTFTTPQMPKRRGFTLEEAMAQKPEETFHPDSLPIFENALSTKLELIKNDDPKGWEPFTLELQESKKSGGYLWTQMSAKVVPDENGKPFEIIGTTHDITDRKQKEQQLRESETRLKQVLDTGRIGSYELDLTTDTPQISALLYEILGISTDSDNLFGEYIANLHPDDVDFVLDAIQKTKTGSTRNTIALEYRYLHPQKGEIWLMGNAKILDRNADGSGGREIGFMQDITERKLQEAEIKNSQEQLQVVFDSTPIIMMLVSRDGRVQKINQTGAQMTGIAPNDVVGMMGGKLFNCIHHVNGNKGCHQEADCNFCDVSNAVEETYATGNNIYKQSGKLTIINNGNPFTLSLLISTTLLEQEGEKIVLIGLDDVTLQKKQEEELAKYKKAIESTNEAIGMSTLDGKASFVNQAFTQMFGYTPEEFNGLEPNVLHVDKALSGQMMGTIMQGNGWKGEIEMYTKAGNIIQVSLSADAITNEAGEIIGLMGVHSDITEQKQREAEREKLLTQQKVANEQAKMGSWYIDCTQEPLFIHMDENLVEIEGTISKDGIAFEEWAKNLAATNTESAKIVEKANVTLANPVVFSWDETYQSKRATDGKVVWLRSKAIINRNSQGNPITLYGSTQDVTEQKQQAKEIVESQKRLEALFENMQTGFAEYEFIWDESGKPFDYRFMKINPAFTEQTGVTTDVIGKTIREIMPNIEKIWIQKFGKLAQDGIPISFEQYNEGTNRYYKTNAFSNRKGHFAILIEDITENRKQQELLAINETRLTQVVEAGNLGSFELNIATNEVEASELAYKLLGLSEVSGVELFNLFFSRIHEDDSERVLDVLNQSKNDLSNPTYKVECRYHHPEKGVIWISIVSKIVSRSDDGSGGKQIGFIQDITEAKELQQEREQTIERQKITQETAKIGSWQIDFSSGKPVMFMDEALIKIQGETFEPGVTPNQMDDWVANTIASNPEKGKAIVENSFAKLADPDVFEHTWEMQYRRSIDNKMIWTKTKAIILRHNNGAPRFVNGVTQDITEQKLAEIERQKQHNFLQALLNSMPDLVFAKDNHGVYNVANPEFSRLVGKKEYEINGKTDYDLFPKKDADFFRKMDKTMMELGTSNTNEEFLTYSDGQKALIEMTKTPITNLDGETIGLIGLGRDVTEKKQAEKDLLTQTELNKKLANISSKYINVPIKDVDIEINNALREIGEHVNADRVYVFDYDLDKGLCSNTFEWCADGITPQIEACQNMPIVELAPDWVEAHKNNEYIHVPDVSVFENKEVREILEAQDIQSMLHMPMFANNKLYGYIGFDSVVQKFRYTEQDISFMRVFAQILANLESRREEEENLNVAKEQAEAALDIANSGAWHIDFVNRPDRVYLDHNLIKIQGEVFDPNIDYYLISDWVESILKSNIRSGSEFVNTLGDIIQNPKTSSFEKEFEYVRPLDKGIIWLRIKANISRDKKGNPLYVQGVTQDITKQKHDEIEILLSQKRLESQIRVNEYEITDHHSFLDYAQNEAIALTESKIGFLYFYYEKTEEFTLNSWSEEVMKECEVAEKQTKYQLNTTGLWGEVVRQRKAIIVNKYSSKHPHAKGTPEGHVKLERFMSIPVFSDKEIVAVVGVANKATAYTTTDQQQLALMMDAVWKKLEQNKAQEAIKQSQANIHHVLNSIPIGVAIKDLNEDKFLFMNKTVMEMLEIDQSETTNFDESLIYVRSHELEELKVELDIKGQFTNKELELVKTKSGKKFWVQATTSRNEYFGTKASLICLYDFTENKNLQFELEQAQQAANSIIDSMAIPTAVSCIKTGEILRVNTAMAKFHGIEMDDFASMKAMDWYVDPNERKAIVQKMEIENRVIDEPATMLRYSTKENRNVLLSFIKLKYNNIDALVGSVVDVTDIKESQRKLENAKEEAEAANVAKSAFLANMSHEIRTPMNAIIGFSEILNKKITDPVHKNFLESIRVSGKNLLGLINDILDFSKIEAGRFELNLAPTNLKTSVAEVEQMFKIRAKEKGLAFNAVIPDNLPTFLLLDELRLKQVIINLVGNALKFTEEGKIEIGIEHTIQTENTCAITVKVSDTGIGISAEEHASIFEAFKQQEQQDNRKFGGTGLGLSISNNLIKLMGSKIELESEKGVGSTFFFTIPNVQHANSENLEEDDYIDISTIKFENSKVLIVDDIENNRRVITGLLAEKGIHFIEAVNGKDGFEKAQAEKPDLVFMDIRMPLMDGYESLKNIRETDEIKNTTVVALTASASKEEVEKVEENGFDGFLPKPVEEELLIKNLMLHLPYKTVDGAAEDNSSKNSNIVAQLNEQERTLLLNNCLDAFQDYQERQSTKNLKKLVSIFIETGKINKSKTIEQIAGELLIANESFNVEKIEDLKKQLETIFKNRNESAKNG